MRPPVSALRPVSTCRRKSESGGLKRLDPPLRMGSQHSSGVRKLNSLISNRQSVQACMGGRVLTVATWSLVQSGQLPLESVHVCSKRGVRHFATDIIGDTGDCSVFRSSLHGLPVRARLRSSVYYIPDIEEIVVRRGRHIQFDLPRCSVQGRPNIFLRVPKF